ncbi:MAG: alpha/beta hydrolase [Pseudomonadota bacterium]
MIELSRIEFSDLDRPEVLAYLFHPRPERAGSRPEKKTAEDVLIPVETAVDIGARFHFADRQALSLLFFHGNGEIVSDYDDLGRLYTDININFLAVDYRGYGRSSGQPAVTGMMRDAHVIFDFVKKWLREKGCTGPVIPMGRSLGSASALEIAAHYGDQIGGLIIESGFAHVIPLLLLLGINAGELGIKDRFQHLDKIKAFTKPTLIIHAEMDHIIPFSDAEALYEACRSQNKRLLRIEGANHNDIFLRGLSDYIQGIKAFRDEIMSRRGDR